MFRGCFCNAVDSDDDETPQEHALTAARKTGRYELHDQLLKMLPSDLNKAVLTIELSSNGFQALPATISQYKLLRKLAIQQNALQEIPKNITKLKSLTCLDVRHNHLHALPELAPLTVLQILRLDGNAFATLPRHLGTVTSLEVLSVSRNPMLALPKVLGELRNLRVADLSYMGVTGFQDDFPIYDFPISSLDKLEQLNLANNGIHRLPPSIGMMTALESLTLQYNKLDTLPVELASLPNLHIVDVRDNKLMVRSSLLQPEHTAELLEAVGRGKLAHRRSFSSSSSSSSSESNGDDVLGHGSAVTLLETVETLLDRALEQVSAGHHDDAAGPSAKAQVLDLITQLQDQALQVNTLGKALLDHPTDDDLKEKLRANKTSLSTHVLSLKDALRSAMEAAQAEETVKVDPHHHISRGVRFAGSPVTATATASADDVEVVVGTIDFGAGIGSASPMADGVSPEILSATLTSARKLLAAKREAAPAAVAPPVETSSPAKAASSGPDHEASVEVVVDDSAITSHVVIPDPPADFVDANHDAPLEQPRASLRLTPMAPRRRAATVLEATSPVLHEIVAEADSPREQPKLQLTPLANRRLRSASTAARIGGLAPVSLSMRSRSDTNGSETAEAAFVETLAEATKENGADEKRAKRKAGTAKQGKSGKGTRSSAVALFASPATPGVAAKALPGTPEFNSIFKSRTELQREIAVEAPVAAETQLARPAARLALSPIQASAAHVGLNASKVLTSSTQAKAARAKIRLGSSLGAGGGDSAATSGASGRARLYARGGGLSSSLRSGPGSAVGGVTERPRTAFRASATATAGASGTRFR